MQVTAPATRQSAGLAYKWIVAMVVIIGVFMAILDSTIVNIAIPRLQTAFGADLHSVQWVLTGYILAQGVATPTVAFFADRLGTKRLYIIALAAFTAGSALCGLAWSLPILIFFRVVQGVGGAALFPLSLTLIFREFPPQERGAAMGLFGVPALLAPALGPTLGGYIVTYAGWQLIFYINVPIGILAVILSMLLLRNYHDQVRSSFDIPGFIFSTIGLASVLYGLSEASTDGWSSTTVVGFLTAGVLALAIFVAVEIFIIRRGGQPLLDLRVFLDRNFSTSSVANVFVVFALYGGLFLLPIYLQDVRGLSAFQAGLILLPQAFASMVSVVIGGWLVDRIGVRAVVIPGLFILALANWQLSSISLDLPYQQLQVILILRGFSLGLVGQPLILAALATIRPHLLTQASSLSTVVRAVASSLGIAVLATLVQSQTQVHYVHLAERVTAGSSLGQLATRLQAALMARGADLASAKTAALQLLAQLVQRQSFDLAIQDAFTLTLVFVFFSVIATLFIGGKRQMLQTAAQEAQEEASIGDVDTGAVEREPALAGV
ncbi:MAG TPA: DHA2 family efflux MFS transporter permease subunit [Ktedonobacteraceae bacterium]|nr:DHA2 family efflux MFS transporter permease subunit [Ktedonobacteraceae bacterium]